MSHEETSYEQNLGRLIQAGCGPETRVTPSVRYRLRRQWLNEYPTRSAPDEFPQVVLGLLTGVLLLLVLGGTWAGWEHGWLPVNSAAASLMVALVGLNLLCLPTAGIIVILRRRWRSCLSV